MNKTDPFVQCNTFLTDIKRRFLSRGFSKMSLLAKGFKFVIQQRCKSLVHGWSNRRGEVEEKRGEVEEKSGLCNVTLSVKGPETR